MKLIFSILGVIVLAVLGLIAFAPTTVKIEASQIIDASQSRVFQEVLSFEARDTWNPWSALDPDMQSEITGTDGTPGAKYTWSGNSDVGSGEQEIMAVKGMERIDTKLTFNEPWQSEADTYITLSELENGTEVKWGFESDAPRPMNAMMLFMKGYIKKDYVKGLQKLKDLIDENPYVYEITEKQLPETYFVGTRKEISMHDVEGFYSEVFPAVFAFLQQKGIESIGMPRGIYFSYNEDYTSADMAAVIAVKDASQVGDAFEVFTVPAGKAVELDYYGAYENLNRGHDELESYLKKHQLTRKFPVSEEYVSDPTTVKDPGEILTRITFWLE